jgi:hypothetical protein
MIKVENGRQIKNGRMPFCKYNVTRAKIAKA